MCWNEGIDKLTLSQTRSQEANNWLNFAFKYRQLTSEGGNALSLRIHIKFLNGHIFGILGGAGRRKNWDNTELLGVGTL